MRLFLVHDRADGFAADAAEPDPDTYPLSTDEARVVEDFPEDLWQLILAGGLPWDDNGTTISHDRAWQPWWDDAQQLWRRHLPTLDTTPSEEP